VKNEDTDMIRLFINLDTLVQLTNRLPTAMDIQDLEAQPPPKECLVEAVKRGIKDRKDDLRQRVEAAKKAPKDRASKEVENALNRMQEDLSNEDLVSAHIHRWVANQWLKASK
jgi:hypothetical protein